MIPNNTYKSVRLLGEGYNLYYSVWCNNEHELYDLSVSPELERIDWLKGSTNKRADGSLPIEQPLYRQKSRRRAQDPGPQLNERDFPSRCFAPRVEILQGCDMHRPVERFASRGAHSKSSRCLEERTRLVLRGTAKGLV